MKKSSPLTGQARTNFLLQQQEAMKRVHPYFAGGFTLKLDGEEAEKARQGASFTVEICHDQTGVTRRYTGVRPVEVRPGEFRFEVGD